MEVKPGYKQTEAGVIPEEWQVKRLGDLFEITSSKRVFQSEWRTQGVPFYRARELAVLGESGSVNNELFITQKMYDEFKRAYGVPKAGEMLVTGVGTLGKVYVVTGDHEFYFKDGNIIWFKIAENVTPEFLRQLYLMPLITKQISDGSAGTTVGTYTISGAKKTVIPFPPLPEQRAIAGALGDVDALLDALEQLIAKKRDLKQATMQQLLTGQKRLPGFSGEWEAKRLGDVAHINMGQSPDSRYYNRAGQGLPLVQGNADIENRRSILRVWTTQVTKSCDKQDLLLTVRAPVGAVGRASLPSCIGRGVCSLKPNGVNQQFLFHALVFAEPSWKILEQGSTFTAANSAQVAAFSLLFAPSVQEQTAIAEVLSDMDTEIAALEERLAKTRALKQGMMQELLTGRVRLV